VNVEVHIVVGSFLIILVDTLERIDNSFGIPLLTTKCISILDCDVTVDICRRLYIAVDTLQFWLRGAGGRSEVCGQNLLLITQPLLVSPKDVWRYVFRLCASTVLRSRLQSVSIPSVSDS